MHERVCTGIEMAKTIARDVLPDGRPQMQRGFVHELSKVSTVEGHPMLAGNAASWRTAAFTMLSGVRCTCTPRCTHSSDIFCGLAALYGRVEDLHAPKTCIPRRDDIE